VLRWGPTPPPQKQRLKKILAHVYFDQTAGLIKTTRGTEVGHSSGSGLCQTRTQVPLPKKGVEPTTPQFLAPFYCGQMAGCINLPLGMEVGFSPRDCVRWGAMPIPQKGAQPLPNFRPMSIVAKRLDGSRWHLACRWAMVQATLCKMGTQLPSPKRGAETPNFGPILLWPNG